MQMDYIVLHFSRHQSNLWGNLYMLEDNCQALTRKQDDNLELLDDVIRAK